MTDRRSCFKAVREVGPDLGGGGWKWGCAATALDGRVFFLPHGDAAQAPLSTFNATCFQHIPLSSSRPHMHSSNLVSCSFLFFIFVFFLFTSFFRPSLPAPLLEHRALTKLAAKFWCSTL